MTTAVSGRAPTAAPSEQVTRDRWHDPAYQAFWPLCIGLTAAPIAFGVDRFAHVLVNWDKYLAPGIVDHLPWTTHQLMYGVGVVEIVAGLLYCSGLASAATWWPPGWPGSS